MKILSIFVAFLENMNFKSKIGNVFCPAIFLHFRMVWHHTTIQFKENFSIMRLPTGACSLKVGSRALNSQKLNLCTAQVNPTQPSSPGHVDSRQWWRDISIFLSPTQENGLKLFLKEDSHFYAPAFSHKLYTATLMEIPGVLKSHWNTKHYNPCLYFFNLLWSYSMW